MSVVVKVENVSKRYQLGRIGTQSLRGDLQRWWARQRGKEDPFGKLDGAGHGTGSDFWALRDVSFDIHQGEALGIIGKNGAGKSTLLKILSRITLPTTGRVRVRGRIASLLEVGTGFNPDLTGRENIFLNGAILGMTKREVQQKLDEIIAFSGIERFIDTPVKRYSSGMYVRLAFSVAAHLESEILILDEVLAVGDAAFQRKCLGKMDDVAHKEGRTILFVSHGMSAIKSFCNRGIVLEKGRVVMDADVTTATDYYNLLDSDAGSSDARNRYCKEWNLDDAPGNDSALVVKAAVVNLRKEGKAIPSLIDTDTHFDIEVRFKVLHDNAIIGMTVVFYDLYDNCVFGSINNYEPNHFAKPMKRGFYRSTCSIPAYFLNNKVFKINLILFGANYSNTLVIEDVLRIDVLDGGYVRKDYLGDYEGVFRPLLPWRTVELVPHLTE
jgi:lipopolysaccharide transport system ATP-binding protein